MADVGYFDSVSTNLKAGVGAHIGMMLNVADYMRSERLHLQAIASMCLTTLSKVLLV